MRKLIPFPRDINPKVNLIAWLEFEVTNSYVTVKYFNYYPRETASYWISGDWYGDVKCELDDN